MTVRELIDALEAYGDHVQVRVGVTGEVRGISDDLYLDAAKIANVDYIETYGSDDLFGPRVVIQIGD